MPKEVEYLSLTTLREKLAKIGATLVSRGRQVTFQLAEVAVPRKLFREILRRIEALRPPPLLSEWASEHGQSPIIRFQAAVQVELFE